MPFVVLGGRAFQRPAVAVSRSGRGKFSPGRKPFSQTLDVLGRKHPPPPKSSSLGFGRAGNTQGKHQLVAGKTEFGCRLAGREKFGHVRSLSLNLRCATCAAIKGNDTDARDRTAKTTVFGFCPASRKQEKAPEKRGLFDDDKKRRDKKDKFKKLFCPATFFPSAPLFGCFIKALNFWLRHACFICIVRIEAGQLSSPLTLELATVR